MLNIIHIMTITSSRYIVIIRSHMKIIKSHRIVMHIEDLTIIMYRNLISSSNLTVRRGNQHHICIITIISFTHIILMISQIKSSNLTKRNV